MGREANKALVRETAVSEPQIVGLSAERKLIIEGIPKGSREWPCWHHGCYYIALYGLRAAMENSCTTIEVKRGTGHRHLFSVIELLNAAKRWWDPNTRVMQSYKFTRNYLNKPKFESGKVPRLLGTRMHQSRGSTLDRTRPLFRVMQKIQPPFAPTSAGKESNDVQ